jgi:hypothetical protein
VEIKLRDDGQGFGIVVNVGTVTSCVCLPRQGFSCPVWFSATHRSNVLGRQWQVLEFVVVFVAERWWGS